MPGESKEQFLSRVREALRTRGEPVDLPSDLEVARVIKPNQDLVAVFAARAEEAKMHVHRVAGEDGLVDKIMGLLEEVGAKKVVVPDEEGMPARERIVGRIQEKGITLCDADNLDALFSVDVGITGVRAAIAETGSMCLASGNGRRRLASLAVPTHIGIVLAAQIVPDLIDWAATSPAERPAGEVLVSAPSKTADIELALVMGVHGPKTEHIIVVG